MPAPPDSGWIDVSVELRPGMVVWPGDPEVEIERVHSIAAGDAANLTGLRMGAHTGTHMDAPVHFVEGGAGIETMPPEAMTGPARVIEIADPVAVTEEELREHEIGAWDRVLFRTRNSDRDWTEGPFDDGYAYVSPAAARHLVAAGVSLVGVDYLSVGGIEDGAETHRALLEAGIWIVEGLRLGEVAAGEYEFICVPLRIVGSDGSPARAILRRL